MSDEEKKTKKKVSKKTTKKSTTKKTTKKAAAKKKTESKKINTEEMQPEVNIGLVGHVDHGKTTLTERLSGKWTDTHSEEMKRGITIKLGYADTLFYKCESCDKYTIKPKCHECKEAETKPVRKVSFVDAPGHESLMATMLAGTTVMDGAVLLVAANEPCPQPQTREHLMALEMSGIKKIVVAQNKIDLVDNEKALKNYAQIKELLKGTTFEDAPIVPISAQHGANISYLIKAIEEQMPTPTTDDSKDPLFLVARSFDINKPGKGPENIIGGIVGGALVQGALKKGDRVEIKPGRILEEQNQLVTKPITAKIISITSGSRQVDKITPGGSVGLMTSLDPSIVKSDHLVGNLIGLPGKLPPVWTNLNMDVKLLERVVGSQQDLEVQPLRKGEVVMLNVNSAATVGQIIELGKDFATMKLRLPICAEVGSRVSISRKVGTRFRLIGFGIIRE